MNLINVLEAKNFKPEGIEIGEDIIEFSSNADLVLAFDGFKSYAIGMLVTNQELSSNNLTPDEIYAEVFQKHIVRSDEVGHELRVKFVVGLSSNLTDTKLKKIYKNVVKYMKETQGECNISYESFVQNVTPLVMQRYLTSQAESLKKLRSLEELKKVAK
jgi:hypothetical protein